MTVVAAPERPRRVARELLQRGPIVGEGGTRGANVVRVCPDAVECRALKDYLPPRTVPTNERCYVAAVDAMKDESAAYNNLLQQQNDDHYKANYHFSLLHHLVLPDALVEENNQERGILMPLFSCNMYDFLKAAHPVVRNDFAKDCNDPYSAFLYSKSFEPIGDPLVIASILYQLTKAVGTLNWGLPHTADGDDKYGFSHNDLHLANLLVHYSTGAMVLCDFELVQHIPPPARLPDDTYGRFPARNRHPPQGLWRSHSDVWGIGLIAVDLLTGVVPIINAQTAFDDFGDGPLLLEADESRDLPVVDWDANLFSHVAKARHYAAPHIPTSDDCSVTNQLYDFCRMCLSNKKTSEQEGQSPSVTSRMLINHPLFERFQEAPGAAEAILKRFLSSVDRRPPDHAVPRKELS